MQQQQPPSNNPAEQPLLTNLKELAELLVKQHHLHEGIYEVGVQLNFAVGSFGLPPNEPAPGAMFTIAGVGLSKATQVSSRSVDAAVVNPMPSAAKKSTKRK